MTERWRDWISAQVGAARGSQAAVARAVGVAPGTVNRWINEGAQPAPEQCKAIAGYFGVPVLRVFVEAGYLTDADADMTEPPNVIAAIRQDPDLLPEAKDHLTRQYGLLLRVRHNPAATQSDPPATTPPTDTAVLDMAARRPKRGTKRGEHDDG